MADGLLKELQAPFPDETVFGKSMLRVDEEKVCVFLFCFPQNKNIGVVAGELFGEPSRTPASCLPRNIDFGRADSGSCFDADRRVSGVRQNSEKGGGEATGKDEEKKRGVEEDGAGGDRSF